MAHHVKNVKNIYTKKIFVQIFSFVSTQCVVGRCEKDHHALKKAEIGQIPFKTLFTQSIHCSMMKKKNTIFADSFENLSLLTTSASKSLVKKRLIMMMMILPTTKS